MDIGAKNEKAIEGPESIRSSPESSEKDHNQLFALGENDRLQMVWRSTHGPEAVADQRQSNRDE